MNSDDKTILQTRTFQSTQFLHADWSTQADRATDFAFLSFPLARFLDGILPLITMRRLLILFLVECSDYGDYMI